MEGSQEKPLLIAAEDGELTRAQESLKATGATVEAHRVVLATDTELSDEGEMHRQMAEPGSAEAD